MTGYGPFARYYDGLMREISYEEKAEDFLATAKNFGWQGKTVLDLACGTGSLSLALAGRGYEVIGVDLSPEMLSAAMEKTTSVGRNVLYLCQDMARLDLYGTVDMAVCAMDSLNHLDSQEKLKQTFERVGLFLAPGGLFLFDMNTPYKHQFLLGDQSYVYETEDVFCVWQNEYHPKNHRVDIQLDFFVPGPGETYTRDSENFTERAYSQRNIEKWLGEAGFAVLGVFGEELFSLPKKDEARWLFAARKI